MSDPLEPMLKRFSCRNFLPQDLPDELLNRILDTAVHAPSGGNLQPVSIIQVRDRVKRETLADWCGQPFMAQAPVHLLFCLDQHRLSRWADLSDAPFTMPKAFRHFWIGFQDVIIAAQQVSAACDLLELGNLYIGTIVEHITETRELFKMPPGVLPVTLLCLGLRGETISPRKKLPRNILIHAEEYRDPSDQELVAAFDQKHPEPLIFRTPELLERLRETALAVGGEELARRVEERVRRDGGINRAQGRFGLHYRAHEMPLGNAEFLRKIKEAGFSFFEE